MNVVRVAAVAALALTALAAPAAAAPPPASGCADVQTVVVRGTGEPDVVGAMGGLARSIAADAEPTVATFGLPYPATADWVNSANAGITQLAAHLTEQAAACPDQRFVLLGYSQGAWVIGDALAGGGGGVPPRVGAALGERIDAIVLWGDPRFRGSEPFNAGTFRATVNGLIPREAGGLAAYAERIRSYCESDDTVCQAGSSGSGHVRYPGSSEIVADGAEFVVSRLDRAPAPTPTPTPSPSGTVPVPAPGSFWAWILSWLFP